MVNEEEEWSGVQYQVHGNYFDMNSLSLRELMCELEMYAQTGSELYEKGSIESTYSLIVL